jgi:hypothetical protein
MRLAWALLFSSQLSGGFRDSKKIVIAEHSSFGRHRFGRLAHLHGLARGTVEFAAA